MPLSSRIRRARAGVVLEVEFVDDGYGVIAPYLNNDLQMRMAETRGMLSWVVFLLLWYVPIIGNAFWGFVSFLAQFVGVPLYLAGLGFSLFQFWR